VDRAVAAEVKPVVRRLETHREVELSEARLFGEHSTELVLRERPLLARVEHEGRGAREVLPGEGLGEHEHDGEPALHVARAGAEEASSLDPGGAVLRPDGVEVPREADAWLPSSLPELGDERVPDADDPGEDVAGAEPRKDGVREGPLLPDGRRDAAQPEQRLVEARVHVRPARRSRAAPR
jgi:hypothetical protein